MSNTHGSDTAARPLPPAIRDTVRVIREQTGKMLEAIELEAALADESLEYRRGFADAAAHVAEILGMLERGES